MCADVSESYDPKRRLIERGPQALTDAELLSVVLRQRQPSPKNATWINGSGLTGLLSLDLSSLMHRGLTEPQATVLSAVAELSRRQARSQLGDRLTTNRPDDVARYLSLRFDVPDQEVMGALYVDMQNRLIGEAEVFRGSLTRIKVEPRALIRRGLVLHAAGLFLFHTHPGGGDPKPSQDDIGFTQRIVEACKLVGIRFMDHIIIGYEGTYASLKSLGHLKSR